MRIIPCINPYIEAGVHFPEVEISYKENVQGFEIVARGKLGSAKMIGVGFISIGNLASVCKQVSVRALCKQLN